MLDKFARKHQIFPNDTKSGTQAAYWHCSVLGFSEIPKLHPTCFACINSMPTRICKEMKHQYVRCYSNNLNNTVTKVIYDTKRNKRLLFPWTTDVSSSPEALGRWTWAVTVAEQTEQNYHKSTMIADMRQSSTSSSHYYKKFMAVESVGNV